MRPSGVHIAAFLGAVKKDGGYKRSLQLTEYARADGHDVLVMPDRKAALVAALQRPQWLVALLLPTIYCGIRFLSLKGCAAMLVYGAWLCGELHRRKWPAVRLEVSANYGILLGNVLVSLRILFQAYPHNVEFMVPSQRQSFFRSLDAAFAAEMRVYRRAQVVHAISDFDATALQALGISSVECLGDVPAPADKEDLLEIKRLRLGADKSGVLIIGSAGNPPTRLGLSRLLRLIATAEGKQRYQLVGFHTECLVDEAPARVHVVGSVETSKLRELMIHTEAVLLFQPPTSGMLTRVIECVIAGIPTYVVGGYLEGRSIKDGNVHAANSVEEFEKAIESARQHS
jgi:hypothetical protein